MNKGQAIRMVNARLGDEVLTTRNTSFSNVNKSKDVWWFNIDPDKFRNESHLLLARGRGVIWLSIEENAIPEPEGVFRIRPDKGTVDLEIATSGSRYMRDVKSGGTGYDFEPHVEMYVRTKKR